MSGNDGRTSDESRRDFLKVMVATGGAVVVAAAAGNALAAPAEPEAQAEPVPDEVRYRETQHIRDYYAKASL